MAFGAGIGIGSAISNCQHELKNENIFHGKFKAVSIIDAIDNSNIMLPKVTFVNEKGFSRMSVMFHYPAHLILAAICTSTPFPVCISRYVMCFTMNIQYYGVPAAQTPLID